MRAHGLDILPKSLHTSLQYCTGTSVGPILTECQQFLDHHINTITLYAM